MVMRWRLCRRPEKLKKRKFAEKIERKFTCCGDEAVRGRKKGKPTQ